MTENKQCVVCLTNDRTIRFAPCSHAVACEECTLKLIQHAIKKELKCPQCTTPVEKLESDSVCLRSDSPPTNRRPIARQPTFLRSFITGESTEGPPALSTVEEFLETEISSGQYSELAKSAKEHWNEVSTAGSIPPALRALRRPAGLLLPQQPWPCARAVVGVLALALVVAYGFGVYAVTQAQAEFNAYTRNATKGFYIKVTQIEGFDGPVNALVPFNESCDADCVNSMLPNPTRHQRARAAVQAETIAARQC